MRGAKPLAVLLILSMLSACAGARTPARDLAGGQGEKGRDAPTTYAEAVEGQAADVADQDRLLLEKSAAAPRHAPSRAAHYHQEPSPGAQHAAEVALLITAQIFVCSFVVVILDGHCELYASTGYHYY
ncbi:MAG: hypothetical protein OEU92_25375 [Alphaproteobacteria bacterium]|nr:hypothetical protein [Alphaproteobacteria bacterium]